MAEHQKLGGVARAISLSTERRAEIARRAAEARWASPQAAYEGDLHIGELTLPSAVLQDGRRVLTSRAFLTALGRPWKGTYQRSDRPNFIDARNLDDFITDELQEYLNAIEFRNLRGQKVEGFRAELLPLVCDVYLRARDQGDVLTENQKKIAKQAEILVRSLSKVGIIGLVDEATGYQSVRARDELQRILAAYISEELLPWATRVLRSIMQLVVDTWGANAAYKTLESIAPRSKPSEKGKTRPSKKKRSLALNVVHRLQLPKERKQLFLLLAERYDERRFLPKVADVRNFLEMRGVDSSHFKTRDQLFHPVVSVLQDISDEGVRKITRMIDRSGPAELGPIADAIRDAGPNLRPVHRQPHFR